MTHTDDPVKLRNYLRFYAAWVGYCEGIDFLPISNCFAQGWEIPWTFSSSF